MKRDLRTTAARSAGRVGLFEAVCPGSRASRMVARPVTQTARIGAEGAPRCWTPGADIFRGRRCRSNTDCSLGTRLGGMVVLTTLRPGIAFVTRRSTARMSSSQFDRNCRPSSRRIQRSTGRQRTCMATRSCTVYGDPRESNRSPEARTSRSPTYLGGEGQPLLLEGLQTEVLANGFVDQIDHADVVLLPPPINGVSEL